MSIKQPSKYDVALFCKQNDTLCDVAFTLDDGRPEHWHTKLARVTESDLTTAGGFIIKYTHITQINTINKVFHDQAPVGERPIPAPTKRKKAAA